MLFVEAAKAQTCRRDIERLRQMIRQQGTPDIQDALDRAERWLGTPSPQTTHDTANGGPRD